MENTHEGWLHYEAGMFLTCLLYCQYSWSSLQLSPTAIERSAEMRERFASRIGTYEPEQLVFVDESAVDRRTTYRGRAWAIRGRKATRKAFFCRGRR